MRERSERLAAHLPRITVGTRHHEVAMQLARSGDRRLIVPKPGREQEREAFDGFARARCQHEASLGAARVDDGVASNANALVLREVGTCELPQGLWRRAVIAGQESADPARAVVAV